jgi:serine/threonine-protein kinase
MAWNYYHGLRDYDNALKEFTLALQAQPNNADVILGIGSVYRRQGNFEEAAVRIQRAVEINPRWSGLSNELAATYTYLRRYADADRLYDRSLALAPEVSLPYEEKAWLLIVWKGDVDGARRVIQDAGEKKVGADDPTFLLIAARVEILGGAYQHALDMLTSSHLEVLAQQFWYIPKSLAMAEIYGYLHQSEQARRQFNAARILLEKNIQLHPDDSRLHSALGIAYAGLGRNNDAVREGKRGVEILPLTKDGMIAPVRMEDLARIYTILGEQEAAIDILQQLLTIPSSQSASLLKLDPAWEGLRGNPRFQRLIAGKGVQ